MSDKEYARRYLELVQELASVISTAEILAEGGSMGHYDYEALVRKIRIIIVENR